MDVDLPDLRKTAKGTESGALSPQSYFVSYWPQFNG
jgi:hypothetical protein